MAGIMNDRVPEPEVWTARLRRFVQDCLASTASEEADRVREAVHLLQDGMPFRLGSREIDPAAVEAMLACGAAESAVLAMMSPAAAFMISRGQGDCCLATVIVSEDGDEVISEGATLALALLGAYVAGLLAVFEHKAGIPCVSFTRPN
jgi:hypothetical protein